MPPPGTGDRDQTTTERGATGSSSHRRASYRRSSRFDLVRVYAHRERARPPKLKARAWSRSRGSALRLHRGRQQGEGALAHLELVVGQTSHHVRALHSINIPFQCSQSDASTPLAERITSGTGDASEAEQTNSQQARCQPVALKRPGEHGGRCELHACTARIGCEHAGECLAAGLYFRFQTTDYPGHPWWSWTSAVERGCARRTGARSDILHLIREEYSPEPIKRVLYYETLILVALGPT